jgi:hypothetical protein
MTTNMSTTDALIRGLLAVLLFAAAIAFNAHVVISFLVALAALVVAGSALTGRCPVYAILGIDTRPRAERHVATRTR